MWRNGPAATSPSGRGHREDDPEEAGSAAVKRKRTTMRMPGADEDDAASSSSARAVQHEYAQHLYNQHALHAHPASRFGAATPGGSIRLDAPSTTAAADADPDDTDDDEGDDDDEVASALLQRHGWPTHVQLQRRLRRAWLSVRLSTVLKVLLALVVLVTVTITLVYRVEDRGRAKHYSIVALLRDMRPELLDAASSADSSSNAFSPAERWQFAVQWSALQSWSAQLPGSHILVFLDSLESCTWLEGRVRDLQCFVLPRECMHEEYQKPRLDCVFPVAHVHAPTDTIVYLNSDVLVGRDLGDALGVMQAKQRDFVLTGRRTDLHLNEQVLRHFASSDFAAKVIETAKREGHMHSPDAIDWIAYQRSWFEKRVLAASAAEGASSGTGTFPPFLAGAPHWDAWFWSRAVLADQTMSIDASASVRVVHVQPRVDVVSTSSSSSGATPSLGLARSSVGGGGRPRVGGPFNEDLARQISGNSWRVGSSISNADLVLQGDCTLGAANVRSEAPTPAVAAPGSDGSVSQADSAASSSAFSERSLLAPSAAPADLSAGCFLASNPNVTDLVLLTRRASPKNNWVAVLPVHAATVPLALHWLCWAERIRFRHFVVHALDNFSARKLRARHVPVLVSPGAPEEIKAPSASQGGVAALPAAHVELLARVLAAGFHVVNADVDSVWMEDPLEDLDALGVDVAAQAVPAAHHVHETATAAEAAAAEAQAAAAFGRGGLLALRSSIQGRYFWNKVVVCQREAPTFAVTRMSSLDAGGDGSPSLPDYAAGECVSRVRLLLQSQPTFSTAILDPRRFVSGVAFFSRFEPQLRGVLPAVIRNDLSPLDALAQIARENPDPKLTLLTAGDQVALQLRRIKEWGLASADTEEEGSEECIVQERMHFPLTADKGSSKSDFRLLIRVLAYNRPASLRRLLKSLLDADYSSKGSMALRLEISVDHPPPLRPGSEEDDAAAEGWAGVLEVARAFRWPHGEKVVVEHAHNIGLGGQWTRGWNPRSPSAGGDERELCLFLEEDVELSPAYFTWLRRTVERVYLDPAQFDAGLYGISLQRQETIVGESIVHRFGSRTPGDVLARMGADPSFNNTLSAQGLYKYQLLGTSGALMFPAPWRAFLAWLAERRVDTIQGTSSLSHTPCVPTLVLNRLWQRAPHKSWTAWFARFVYEKGWYALYAHFPNEAALAINHRESGPVRGVQPMLLPKNAFASGSGKQLLTFPSSPRAIPTFDFHFRLVSEPSTLVFRSSLAAERFMGVQSGPVEAEDVGAMEKSGDLQCWMVDQLAPQLRREAEIRRARAEAVVREQQEIAQAAAEAAAKAAEAARMADLAAKRKARLAAAAAARQAQQQAANGTLPLSGSDAAGTTAAADTAAAKSKDKSKPTGKPKDDKSKAADKSKDKDKKKAKPGPRASARLKELASFSKLPAGEITAAFDASASAATARLHRFLSVSLAPLWLGYPKSKWLTLDDGRFGAVAHFIAGQVDKEAKVTASAASQAVFALPGATDKLAALAPALSTRALDPAALVPPLKPNEFDFVVSATSFGHADHPDQQVRQMLKLAKKAVILIEPHDTKIDAEKAALFSVALQKALAPLAGTTGVGSGVRSDAGELTALAKESGSGVTTLLFRVFAEEDDVAQAEKDAAAGLRPSAVLATVMLKKAPTPHQLARFVKAGFIPANLE